MPTIGEVVYADAQERLRRSINERARPLGWGLRLVSSTGWAPRWLGDDRWRNDQYEVLYDSLWELSQSSPDGIEAEAVEWLRRNSPDTYRRVRAGVSDTVPLSD